MQNSQPINWWLEILKIAVPSLVALIVPFVTYLWITRKMADYQTRLSKEIEDYKRGISKELYEFQARFSLFHQQKADAIANLYEDLIDLERAVVNAHQAFSDDARSNATDEAHKKFYDYFDAYEKKRIYFDDDLCEKIEEVKILVTEMFERYRVSNNCRIERASISPDIIDKAYESEEESYKKFIAEFPKLRYKLCDEFRQTLFVGNPNNQL